MRYEFEVGVPIYVEYVEGIYYWEFPYFKGVAEITRKLEFSLPLIRSTFCDRVSFTATFEKEARK